MSNREILKKAIQKAIDGGWKHYSMANDELEPEIFVYADSSMVNFGYHLNNRIYYLGGNAEPTNNLIYSHDFAKALFGKKEHGTDGAKWGAADNCTRCGMIDHEHSTYYCWQYHLQQMVIAPDPIKYLGENI